MKTTKTDLEQIIREEIQKVLEEANFGQGEDGNLKSLSAKGDAILAKRGGFGKIMKDIAVAAKTIRMATTQIGGVGSKEWNSMRESTKLGFFKLRKLIMDDEDVKATMELSSESDSAEVERLAKGVKADGGERQFAALKEGNMKGLEGEIVNGLMEMMQSLNIDLEMIKGVIDSGAVQDAMYMLGVDQPGTMME